MLRAMPFQFLFIKDTSLTVWLTITKKFSFFIARHEVSMDSFDLGSDGWYRKRSSSHLWPQVKRRLLLS